MAMTDREAITLLENKCAHCKLDSHYDCESCATYNSLKALHERVGHGMSRAERCAAMQELHDDVLLNFCIGYYDTRFTSVPKVGTKVFMEIPSIHNRSLPPKLESNWVIQSIGRKYFYCGRIDSQITLKFSKDSWHEADTSYSGSNYRIWLTESDFEKFMERKKERISVAGFINNGFSFSRVDHETIHEMFELLKETGYIK